MLKFCDDVADPAARATLKGPKFDSPGLRNAQDQRKALSRLGDADRGIGGFRSIGGRNLQPRTDGLTEIQDFPVIRRGDLGVAVKQFTIAQPNRECFDCCDLISGLVRSALLLKTAQIERIQKFVEEGEFAGDGILPGETHSTPS
jgi:hypothetical protein